jgi:hypothetical protein
MLTAYLCKRYYITGSISSIWNNESPVTDGDADGLGNAQDNAPTVPNPDQADTDNDMKVVP